MDIKGRRGTVFVLSGEYEAILPVTEEIAGSIPVSPTDVP